MTAHRLPVDRHIRPHRAPFGVPMRPSRSSNPVDALAADAEIVSENDQLFLVVCVTPENLDRLAALGAAIEDLESGDDAEKEQGDEEPWFSPVIRGGNEVVAS